MSTEAPEVAEPAPKRRGRPPGAKARKRRDPEPAPIDGDYQPLDVVGKQPGFTYVAYSDWDMQRRGHLFEIERWSPTCAHAPYETFTPDKLGQPVKLNRQLTLCKAPTARVEARHKRERDAHRLLTGSLVTQNASRGHTTNERSINTHTIKVN